jgi:DHA1 family tetracycline resistance protein-like MFS transporter
VILISNIGLGLDYILMALAPSLIGLFVGRIISGIASANIATGYAYIADVTEPERRAKAFGLLGAAFGAGFILGPAIGGLLGAVDPRLPFWAAASFSLVNAGYGLFVLPESLPRAHREQFSWRRANPMGALALRRSHRELFGLAASNFVSYLAHMVLQTVFVLYAGYRYGWGERAVGLTLALVGVCSLIVQAGLVGWIVGRIGERTAVILGLACGAIGMAIYGIADTGWLFLVGIPIMSLWGVAGASMQAIMTRRVAVSEQGQLQGANNSLTGIASMIGPLAFAGLFAWSIEADRGQSLVGASFYLAAAMLVVATAIAWLATKATPAAGKT